MSKRCVDVAFYWTPREAAAILDYLDRLRDCVWQMYEQDIIELRQGEEIEIDATDDQQELDLDGYEPPWPSHEGQI